MTVTTLEAETKMVGPHEFRFIPPDRIWIAFCGDFDLPHAEPYLDFVFGYGEKCGCQLCVIYDFSHAGRFTPSLRKRVVEFDRPYPYAGAAFIGTNITTRTIIAMFFTAGRILKPTHVGFPYKFVESLDEADAWFDELKSNG